MKIICGFFPRKWQTAAFDTQRGTGYVRWFSPLPKQLHGEAHRHCLRWYALWADGETLVFQAGRRQWRITPDMSAENILSGRRRTFRLLKGSDVLFEITYRAIDRPRDVTFDALDLQLEDFFVSLALTLNESPEDHLKLAQLWSRRSQE